MAIAEWYFVIVLGTGLVSYVVMLGVLTWRAHRTFRHTIRQGRRKA